MARAALLSLATERVGASTPLGISTGSTALAPSCTLSSVQYGTVRRSDHRVFVLCVCQTDSKFVTSRRAVLALYARTPPMVSAVDSRSRVAPALPRSRTSGVSRHPRTFAFVPNASTVLNKLWGNNSTLREHDLKLWSVAGKVAGKSTTIGPWSQPGSVGGNEATHQDHCSLEVYLYARGVRCIPRCFSFYSTVFTTVLNLACKRRRKAVQYSNFQNTVTFLWRFNFYSKGVWP